MKPWQSKLICLRARWMLFSRLKLPLFSKLKVSLRMLNLLIVLFRIRDTHPFYHWWRFYLRFRKSPLILAVNSVLGMFLLLFILPHHPMAIPTAIGSGLAIALLIH